MSKRVSEKSKQISEEFGTEWILQLNRWILTPIAAWPSDSKLSLPRKLFSWTVRVICYILISFLFIPCALVCIYDVPSLYEKIKFSGPLSFCVMVTAKYSSLILAAKDIYMCLEHIADDWRNMKFEKDRIIMTENAHFGRRLVMICSTLVYGGLIFYYAALPLSVGKISAEGENLTFFKLPFPIPKLFGDPRVSPMNEICFLLQFLSGMVMHSISAGVCSLIATFAMHACGQLQVLMLWLEHMVDGREDFSKNVDHRIAMIVEHHIRTLSFVNRTEKIFRNINLVEIMGCTLNMCLDGYYLIMDTSIDQPLVLLTNITFLFSFTFNIFILCYIGELVTEQCKKLGEVTYLTDWYRLDGKKALGIIFIITTANSSPKLTAGNFIDLTIASFGDVVRTSVAYLNMLRALTD